jgi:alpha-L-rhamnosidase
VGKLPTLTPDGKKLTESTAEIALVGDEGSLGKALQNAVKPDFQIASRGCTLPASANEPEPCGLPLTSDAANSRISSQIGFIRRKLPNADIYFVTNTANTPMVTTATFATTHKFAEEWDGDTASASAASATGQAIHLAPYGSRVFVFSDTAANAKPALDPTKQVADLSSDWKVNFVAAKRTVTEAKLTDWLADPSTKNYSGEAIYSRDFTVAAKTSGAVYLEVLGGKPVAGAPNSPPEARVLGLDGLPDPRVTRAEPRNYAYYDAPIREAALVTINGKDAGALWHPPYRLDVSPLLKAGVNHIEIHVYNTALNAWAAMPPHDFAPLTAKYGDKFQMQDLEKVMALPSGLLGPVHLVAEAK